MEKGTSLMAEGKYTSLYTSHWTVSYEAITAETAKKPVFSDVTSSSLKNVISTTFYDVTPQTIIRQMITFIG
jgi:hypothetical protein